MKCLLLAILIAFSTTCVAETLSGLCILSPSPHNNEGATAQVLLSESNCSENLGECMETSNSSFDWSRWKGASPQLLQVDNSPLSARLVGDAGELVCNGVVHDGALLGRFHFNANEVFPHTMTELGFHGITARMQLSFLLTDVTIPWSSELKSVGVTELTANELIGLRALHVDGDYIHAIAAAGYPELRAGKLIEMRAVGVTPEKARAAKAMGFQPTEEELIQMSIFKVDQPFVDRMRARGMKDLTLARLIKMKTFRLD